MTLALHRLNDGGGLFAGGAGPFGAPVRHAPGSPHQGARQGRHHRDRGRQCLDPGCLCSGSQCSLCPAGGPARDRLCDGGCGRNVGAALAATVRKLVRFPRCLARYNPQGNEIAAAPTSPSVTPCSPPSRTLRAASGGGLRPSLTAAARGVTGPGQVGTEKRPSGRTKKLTAKNHNRAATAAA